MFPILTARRIYYKPVFGELAAFLRGAELLRTYKMYGCNYWDANAAAWPKNHGLTELENMRVGRIYGVQWRNWNGPHDDIDQIKNLVAGIKSNPEGRRHIISAYNPGELDDGCLPPCHLLAQFYVTKSGHLDCMVYMRSVDLCLGLPSDVVLYATLLLLVAKEVELSPGHLIFSMADSHIYENHLHTWDEQRRALCYDLPTWILKQETSLEDFLPTDLILPDYKHGDTIRYEFNV
jgi:thymidylate synthase